MYELITVSRKRRVIARWWISMAEARVQWNVFVDMEDSMKGGNDLIFMLTIN